MENIEIMATCTCIILGILMCIGTILNLKGKASRRKHEEYSKSTCLNCGGNIVFYYYNGGYLFYCPNCKCGYKPKEIFYNSEGGMYAEEVERKDLNAVVDLKYIPPKFIKPDVCNKCGAKTFYQNRNNGKCISCGRLV